ncbi:MoxR family ATPase, partial [Candidatus Woesearchaeota archaeon]|nr:MoxR family ATPase [Candidatus Woesearchaeota archaeon]
MAVFTNTEPSKTEMDRLEEQIKKYHTLILKAKAEVDEVVLGQEKVIDGLFRAVFAGGHALLEGVSGTGKAILAKTMANAVGCTSARVRMSPESRVADLVSNGGKKGMKNFLVVEDINHAPGRVQSALIQAMHNKQIIVEGSAVKLPSPFSVVGTQNPAEHHGALKKSLVNRFMFKLTVGYPSAEHEQEMLNNNMEMHDFEEFDVTQVISAQQLAEIQGIVKKIYVSKKIEKYIVSIVDATRHPEKYRIKLARYVELGASPMGAISLLLGAK